MSTCNRLDLQTLGSQPTMSKNLPDLWVRGEFGGSLMVDQSIRYMGTCLIDWTPMFEW